MNRNSRSNRRSNRHPDRIEFARNQRAQANEFAHDVWQMLRASRIRGQKFRREHPIAPYTVDFVCLALKIVVEVDGKDHQTAEGQHHDQIRDRFLRRQGFEVLRFDGYQVTQDLAGVRRKIENAIDLRIQQGRSPLIPSPSPPDSTQAPLA